MLEIYSFISAFSKRSLDLNRNIVDLQADLAVTSRLNLIPLMRFSTSTLDKDDYLIQNISAREAVYINDAMTNVMKTAHFQGKKVGRRLSIILQEKVLAAKAYNDSIVRCALIEANVDLETFNQDLTSDFLKKALQMDQRISHDMGVKNSNTLVVFDSSRDDSAERYTDVQVDDLNRIFRVSSNACQE
ncbi:DsbA family protein [Weissella diestrammenae]|uniref:DsbA family protein n=1 Tax=Weissella diestrammenae TaxID=1162633 RepID=A0A7G9T4C1_9LACO|nr:DsbA family protein [Weissella diestrammenae]MCM0583481.1 DsbA family protein [Weissella diestrammenae]QNN74946.1 DsbA family protein [Weissella diestrammenae]